MGGRTARSEGEMGRWGDGSGMIIWAGRERNCVEKWRWRSSRQRGGIRWDLIREDDTKPEERETPDRFIESYFYLHSISALNCLDRH